MTQFAAEITVDTRIIRNQVSIGNVQRKKRKKSRTVWSDESKKESSITENKAGVGAMKDSPIEAGSCCISR